MMKSNYFAKTFSLVTIFCLTISLSAIAGSVNSLANPKAIKLNSNTQLTIFPKGNTFFYKLNIPEEGYLSCTTKNIPKSFEISAKFLLFDEFDGQKVIRNWTDANIPILLDKGEIIVQIGESWNDGESKQEFSVNFHLTPQMDKFERNNSMETAKPCELGKPMAIAICPKGDHDWFSINITKSGYLAIQTQATGMPDKLGIRQRVYKLNNDKLEKLGEGKTNKDMACFVKEPGKYFIEIYDDWDDKASFQLFKFRPSLLDNYDLAEPNNNYSQAKDFPASGEAKMSLFPIGDRDYFKISSKTTGKINVTHSPISGVTVKCSLYEIISEKEQKEVTKYTSLPHEFELIAGKKYLLVINEDWDDNTNIETFTLFVKNIDAPVQAISKAETATKTPKSPTNEPIQIKAKPVIPSKSRPVETPLVVVPNLIMKNVNFARQHLLRIPLIPKIVQATSNTGTPQNIPDFNIKLGALLAANAKRSRNSRSSIQYVVAQKPAPGTRVTKQSFVLLTTRLSSPQQVIAQPKPPTTKPNPVITKPKYVIPQPKAIVKKYPVPNVVGKLKIVAKSILKKHGFGARYKGKKVGFVSKQSPSANTQAKRGSVITVTIGK